MKYRSPKMRASAATRASAVSGKNSICKNPVGLPQARSTRSATQIAKNHRPENAAMSTPTIVSGQKGSKKPAAASKKETAYIHRLLDVIGAKARLRQNATLRD